MDDEDGGILNIQLSESDDESKVDRTRQTEPEFQVVKRGYHTKVENGNIHKQICLPLGPGANKQHIQEVLHAVEELYYFRRFADALDFIKTLQNDGSMRALDSDTCKLLQVYEERCRRKLHAESV
ncbi:hypothetical protein DCS_01650 [Drechmeria coniospora]|uniref:Uncharacterized protein n=1 Tax=Drechmeria coniospora TaxID=98403 RepID=A0A151GTX7_DRECN|nr:hypothetical protein DCS_01650 [Drechmeria coniospora]KYK60513.1 hypothetical protein DCS_01650 [Drechmeria coniospora]ODA80668.1 hypothetical protein RJ55_03627 [Drechmeria coniospora]